MRRSWGALVAPAFFAVVHGCADPAAGVEVGAGSAAVAVTWTNAVGVAPSGNDLLKTSATTGWNAGAASVETLAGDGYVEFTTGEATTHKMAGLSLGDSGQGRADIDFAIHLKSTGVVGIYEAGALRDNDVGTYIAGDVFRVEVTDGVVSYGMNGALPFYTSAVAPSFPLRVDTSLNTPNATLDDVTLVEAGDACPAYQGGGPVCDGSFTVNNAFDLAEIAACAEITGNLTIDAPGMSIIALPALERVGGDLLVAGNSGLQRLRLPQLKEVGGMLQGSLLAATTGVDLSRLQSVGSMFLVAPGVALRLACLESSAGALAVNASLPRLRSVTGTLSGSITAPVLETVGGDAGPTLAAPMLTSVGGTLSYGNQTDVPSLETVGALAHGVEMGGPNTGRCLGTGALTSLELPALERAGAVAVCSDALATVDLSALQKIIGPQVGSAGLFIDPASTAGTVAFPALQTVRGNVEIVAPANAPVLTQIRTGALRIHDSLTAPSLAEVRGFLVVEPNAGAVSLPALLSVKAIDALAASALTSLDLPALTTVTGSISGGISIRLQSTSLPQLTLPSLTSTASGLRVYRNASLLSVSLPALETSDGTLRIEQNDGLTSIDFPSLASIGSSFVVADNPSLPTCQATDLRDQLLAAGWTGSVTIIDNDDSGTCP